jgi:hypothetical protein
MLCQRGLLLAVCLAGSLQAVSIDAAYIFSSFSQPSNQSTVPFTFIGEGKYGYSMNLVNGVAQSVSLLGEGNDVKSRIQKPLTYSSHSGTINSGESFSNMKARVDSEINRLDDVGFFQEKSDAALNLDFSDNAAVVMASPGTAQRPLYNLLIAEDAGIDPFKLEYCPTAACTSSTRTLLFNGFSSAAMNSLLQGPLNNGGGYFQTGDYIGNVNDPSSVRRVDQLFLFRFSQPIVGGFFRISETSNYGGTTLEIDFAGGTVPEPGTYLLTGTGAAMLALAGWRRRRANIKSARTPESSGA